MTIGIHSLFNCFNDSVHSGIVHHSTIHLYCPVVIDEIFNFLCTIININNKLQKYLRMGVMHNRSKAAYTNPFLS